MTPLCSLHSMFSHKVTLARSSKGEYIAQATEYIPMEGGEIFLGALFLQYGGARTYEGQLPQLSATTISLESLRQSQGSSFLCNCIFQYFN